MAIDNLQKAETTANPATLPASKFLQWLFAIFLLTSTLFLLVNIPFQTTYFEGTAWFKQPRTWPGIAILGMLVAAIGHYLTVRQTKEAGNALSTGRDVKLLLGAVEIGAWFVGFIFSVNYLGYLPSNIIFAVFLCWRLRYRQPRYFLNAALIAIVIVILFKSILQVRIPGGEAYGLLPTHISRFLNTYL